MCKLFVFDRNTKCHIIIDSNCMPNRLRLCNAGRLENHIHLYLNLVCSFSFFLTQLCDNPISSSSSNHAASTNFSDSPSIRSYLPSLSAGPPYNILCLHKTVIGKFLLVVQHWHVHMKRFIRERHL